MTRRPGPAALLLASERSGAGVRSSPRERAGLAAGSASGDHHTLPLWPVDLYLIFRGGSLRSVRMAFIPGDSGRLPFGESYHGRTVVSLRQASSSLHSLRGGAGLEVVPHRAFILSLSFSASSLSGNGGPRTSARFPASEEPHISIGIGLQCSTACHLGMMYLLPIYSSGVRVPPGFTGLLSFPLPSDHGHGPVSAASDGSVRVSHVAGVLLFISVFVFVVFVDTSRSRYHPRVASGRLVGLSRRRTSGWSLLHPPLSSGFPRPASVFLPVLASPSFRCLQMRSSLVRGKSGGVRERSTCYSGLKLEAGFGPALLVGRVFRYLHVILRCC
jgi:hypothetical protein